MPTAGSLCDVLNHLRHRARAHSWLSYLLMLMLPLLLLSGFGLPASTHAAPVQSAAHASHCQQHAAPSASEKSAVSEHDCCKNGACICSVLTQTALNNPALAFGESLPPLRVFVSSTSPHLPALALANLLRPPIV
ncbi:hypothetical protein [Pseudolysobacter antarcticus]|uniref:hypothetical protein n=1 Tax=Pseudolysobacter antarcticus TaxID=2511995 RepID=UPI0013ED0FEB|nr:hypothetical protein [Pseudolysobacter antarcticus]